MRKLLLLLLLALFMLPVMAQETTAYDDTYITIYDTHQHFVASTTDYALSESFTGFPVGMTQLVVVATCQDSIDTDGASANTPAKYLVATLQASNDNINFFDVGNALVDQHLCAVPATTATAGTNNKGLSSTVVINVSNITAPFMRIRYDMYASDSRLTDTTANTSVVTRIRIIKQ